VKFPNLWGALNWRSPAPEAFLAVFCGFVHLARSLQSSWQDPPNGSDGSIREYQNVRFQHFRSEDARFGDRFVRQLAARFRRHGPRPADRLSHPNQLNSKEKTMTFANPTHKLFASVSALFASLLLVSAAIGPVLPIA
jgi:hypothetical protein